MASYHFLMLLLALCALGVGTRLIEQPSTAVETDSSLLSADNAKESVPYKVVETKDEYEIREYNEGRFRRLCIVTAPWTSQQPSPLITRPIGMCDASAGDFAATEAFQSSFTISYTKVRFRAFRRRI